MELPPDDQQLLAGITDRDPEAFRSLMERFSGPITNLAYRFLESRPDAEEAAQEVFLSLYQHPPRLHPDVKLFTWLYRVTVNRCLDVLRKRKRTPPTLSLDQQEAPGEEEGEPLGQRIPHASARTPREQAAQMELVAATRRAVTSLPARLKAPLLLSAFEELSQDEIGQILGLSPKAVERRIHRARQILRTRLQPYL